MGGKAMARTSAESSRGEVERVYAYYGADDARKRAAVERLAAELIDPDVRDFDLETLYGPGLTAERLILASGVAPLASKRRLLVVTQANGIDRAEQEIMTKRLDRVPESACVVFLTSAPEMKEGKPKRGSELHPELMKAVRKVGKAIEFPHMKDPAAALFVRELLKEAGKAIRPSVAAAAVRRSGTDSGVLATEAAKLASYVGERDTVTDEDVEEVTSQTAEGKIFALMDAVGTKDAAQALRHLRPLLEGGGDVQREALRVLGMLARHLRQLWQARVLLDAGCKVTAPGKVPEHVQAVLPRDSILEAEGWRLAKLDAQAKNFTIGDLVRGFERIAAADLAIKGIQGDISDPATALEVLVIELSTRRQGGRRGEATFPSR
jgi:DNA polymerase-3 subunit delta